MRVRCIKNDQLLSIGNSVEEAPGDTYPDLRLLGVFATFRSPKTVELYNSEIRSCHKDKEIGGWNEGSSVSYFATMIGQLFTYSLSEHQLKFCFRVQAILDYSNQNGYASYTTLGYDGFYAQVGVAWIKIIGFAGRI